MKQPLLISATCLVFTGGILFMREGRYQELLKTRTQAEIDQQLSLIIRQREIDSFETSSKRVLSHQYGVDIHALLEKMRAPFDTERLLQDYQKAYEDGSTYYKIVVLFAAIVDRSPEELAELLKLVKAAEQNHTMTQLSNMIEELLGKDRDSEREKIESALSEESGISPHTAFLFEAWAHRDPKAALDWLESSEEAGLFIQKGTFHDPLKTLNENYVLALTKRDAKSGFEFFRSLDPDYRSTELNSRLLHALSRKTNQNDAVEFLKLIDESERQSLLNYYKSNNDQKGNRAFEILNNFHEEDFIETVP